MQGRHSRTVIRLKILIRVTMVLCGSACLVSTPACHLSSNSLPRPGAVDQEQAAVTQPSSELPRLANIVPALGAWGPRNAEYTKIDKPRLPEYAGWYRLSYWEMRLAAAGQGVLLVTNADGDRGHMSALDADSGRLLWRAAPGTGCAGVRVIKGLVLFNRGAGDGVDLKTGALVRRSQLGLGRGDLAQFAQDPGWTSGLPAAQAGRGDAGPSLCSAVLTDYGYQVLQEVEHDGQLLVAAAYQPSPYKSIETFVLFRLRLDSEGRLTPGKLEPAFPLNLRAAVDEFYSMDDPLADADLMSVLAGEELSGLNQLRKRIKHARSNHILALIALCEYYRPAADAPYTDYYVRERILWPMADNLLSALAAKPDPAWAPAIGAWLEQAPNDLLAYKLLCLLMKMRSPEAYAVLGRFYDERIYSRRQPLKPPYKLIKPVDTSRWASCPAASKKAPGLRDVAFVREDIYEGDTIFVCLDVDAANMAREILYTGLTDKRSLEGDERYLSVLPATKPLAVSTTRTSAEILHHTRASDTRPVAATLVTSKVEYAALRADSDQDGLPDIVEQQLRLDPANPDIDGDGLLDGEDSLPNIEQSKFGPLERGLQRAMVCDLLMRKDYSVGETPLPWSAQYFTAGGCAPVAISYSPTGCGIYVDPATWPSTRPEYCTVQVVDLRRDTAAPADRKSVV